MKRLILISIIICTMFGFGIVLAQGLFYAPTGEMAYHDPVVKTLPSVFGNPEKTKAKDQVASDEQIYISESRLPKYLRVPTLDIDTKVQRVGITTKGNMGTPNNYTDVGWYDRGAVPGEVGSAVMAGHVDNGLALPGVFKKLNELKEGDEVFVDTLGGESLRFKVVNLKLYDWDSKPEEVFYSKDAAYLRLVTCAGTWVPKNKTHDKRLVVTTVLSP